MLPITPFLRNRLRAASEWRTFPIHALRPTICPKIAHPCGRFRLKHGVVSVSDALPPSAGPQGHHCTRYSNAAAATVICVTLRTRPQRQLRAASRSRRTAARRFLGPWRNATSQELPKPTGDVFPSGRVRHSDGRVYGRECHEVHDDRDRRRRGPSDFAVAAPNAVAGRALQRSVAGPYDRLGPGGDALKSAYARRFLFVDWPRPASRDARNHDHAQVPRPLLREAGGFLERVVDVRLALIA